jgi:hypothetical protein
MILKRRAVLVICSGLTWPWRAQANIGFNPSPCTESTPAKDTPAAKAEVIFRAKALKTRGVDTEMQVMEVQKGDVPVGKVIFKHAIAPKAQPLEDLRRYYLLKDEQTYLIYANKTSRKNVFTQLYREDYCGASVIPTQP